MILYFVIFKKKKDKDYVWKGYDYLIEYAFQPTNKEYK